MGSLSPSGLIVANNPDLKKELTVRPVKNAIGIQPPSFKVWRSSGEEMVIPRYFGRERFGPPATDTRSTPRGANIVFNGTLRSETHQDRAFERGVKAFSELGGGVLSLPPGYGKTAMALAFAAHLKVRTIIIVHKEFLANQWKERINQFCPGATVGRIQEDTFDVEKDFVVAMIQTLCMRQVGSLDDFGFVIVDEAHHIGAAAFSQTMFKLCPRYTLGLTATPERKDGLTRLLYWFMGPEFYRTERLNQGKTRVITLNFKHDMYSEEPPTTRFGKVNMAEMCNRISDLNSRRELIINTVKECIQANRKILVLCDRRELCTWINSQFDSKISGLYMGLMKEKDLDETSRKQVIVATFAMAQEGLDIPALDTCILASPRSDVTQAVGRIMRETTGKVNSPLIYDIVDHWGMLFAMYRKRKAFYKTSGFEFKEDEPPQKKLKACAFI